MTTKRELQDQIDRERAASACRVEQRVREEIGRQRLARVLIERILGRPDWTMTTDGGALSGADAPLTITLYAPAPPAPPAPPRDAADTYAGRFFKHPPAARSSLSSSRKPARPRKRSRRRQ